MDAFTITSLALATILGASIGSFANVVAYRMPLGQSLNNPPSRCPKCERHLTPLELIPVLSWLALKGRCRGCRTRISPRYPIIETLFALTFLGLALLTQPDLLQASELTRYVLQAAALSMLLMAALIDLDTRTLPDTLVYGALLTGLAASLLPANPATPSGLVKTAGETLTIALAAAGALALLERYATLAMRRLRHPKHGTLPITTDHLLMATTLAAFLGVPRALAITTAIILIDTKSTKPLRLPQPLLLALAPLLVLLGRFLGRNALTATTDALAAAGAIALAAGITWWVSDHLKHRSREPEPEDDNDTDVTLGFGDVKLAAALAALLPTPTLLILALMLASLTGTLHSVATRQRALPFGPHLLLGCVLAATLGPNIITWYAHIAGVPL